MVCRPGMVFEITDKAGALPAGKEEPGAGCGLRRTVPGQIRYQVTDNLARSAEEKKQTTGSAGDGSSWTNSHPV